MSLGGSHGRSFLFLLCHLVRHMSTTEQRVQRVQQVQPPQNPHHWIRVQLARNSRQRQRVVQGELVCEQ